MALPATEVHAQQPPPLKHDYETLDELAKRSKCVFRVWQSNSASPLIWTGHPDTSGFKSPNGNASRISRKAYLDAYKNNRGQVEWAEGAYMKQTVVDHIAKKWRQTALNYPGMVSDEDGRDIPEDDKSPWISTSKDMLWCMWEVSRRLARATAPPKDCNPDDPNGIDPAKREAWRRSQKRAVVNLTIVRHHSGTIGLQDARRNYLESHIDAKGPTGRTNKDMSVSLQGDYDNARRLAISSHEILYYGRIFSENIDSNVEWTIDKMPFPLPEYFFRHSTRSRPASPDSENADVTALRGWLADLVWDPRRDDLFTATRKVKNRKRDLEMPRQPQRFMSGWAGQQSRNGSDGTARTEADDDDGWGGSRKGTSEPRGPSSSAGDGSEEKRRGRGGRCRRGGRGRGRGR